MEHLLGVFTTPGATLAGVMEKKRWVAAFLLVLAAAAIFTYVTYPVVKVDQARLIRESPLADKIPADRLDAMDQFTPTQRVVGSLSASLFTALSLLLGAFFVYLFYKLGGVNGLFMQFFSAVSVASLIDGVLGGLVRTTLVLAKKSMFVSTGLAAFVPGLTVQSLWFVILSQFDLFAIWYLVVLALGLAAFAKISLQKSLTYVGYYFVFKLVITTLFSFLSMRMMGMGG
jgi:hypothetical protein